MNQFVYQIEQAMGDEELIRLGKEWVKRRTWKANARRYSEIYTYLKETIPKVRREPNFSMVKKENA